MRFQFLHTHANGCYFLFFFFIVYSHSNEHEAVSHTVVLIFIPLITADVKQFFRCLTIYIFSLGKNVYLNPLSIFELGCSCCWVVGVLFISWILLTYQICGLQMFFSHSVGCFFYSLDNVLWYTKLFNFDKVQKYVFSFIALIMVSY